MAASEYTPLLAKRPSTIPDDLEGQKTQLKTNRFRDVLESGRGLISTSGHVLAVTVQPKRWDRELIWRSMVIAPVSCLPAVCVGLLLNILDALSYGWFLTMFTMNLKITANLTQA